MSFKRGFLNSKKGRDALATEPTSASGSNPRSSEPVIETAQNDTNDPPARDDATGSLPPSPDESEASETQVVYCSSLVDRPC
ncbi:hypothetical protein PENSPDRAFT_177053 [Peniophora sp. CONT]|nr:hypothetical protein PENSPDRAFT_177053 [Peniophora sp. CONT]